MRISLEFDRIAPGVEIGPHHHGLESIVYLAAGELTFEHGEGLARRTVVRAGDVLYEAPAEEHLVRNEGRVDALVLLATTDPDPRRIASLLRRWDQPDEPVRRPGPRDVGEAGIVRRRIMRPGDFGTTAFTVTEIEIPAGRGDAWHRHPRAEQALVVLAGRGVIEVGNLSETLEPLTGVRVEEDRPHRVANTGRTPLRYVVITSPGLDPGIDRELAEAPDRGRRADG